MPFIIFFAGPRIVAHSNLRSKNKCMFCDMVKCNITFLLLAKGNQRYMTRTDIPIGNEMEKCTCITKKDFDADFKKFCICLDASHSF